ncbi:MAG: DUF4493 domain-containing protein [Muribaculaceae bacterium]|nr:DUF4493 domain-containing protein [Muribaculaceae bacterium]
MKNKIFSLLAALMSVLAFTGCDDWTPGSKQFAANTGGVNLGDMAVNVNENSVPGSRAGVDTSGYLVTITDKAKGEVAVYDGKACSWKYSEMPEVMTLPVGDYIVNVLSNTPEKAAWSAPTFEGSKEFTVKNNEITAIGTVTCVFASIKVDVKFSEDLLANMSSDSQVKVVANDEGTLTWNSTETRSGYFEALSQSTTLVATFTGTVKGQAVTRTQAFTDVEKGKYYIITFSLKNGPAMPDETGNIDPNGGITVNGDIEESDENGDVVSPETPENPGGRPDDEEWPDNPNPPTPDEPDDPVTPTENVITITCPSMPDFSQWYPTNLPSYSLTVTSTKPLAHLWVNIQSDYLTDEFLQGIGLCANFDLADPRDGSGNDLSGVLGDPAGFNFPVGSDMVGKTSVSFDLTPFIPLLNLGLTNTPPVQKHIFKLTVNDNEGTEKIAELKFDATL